MNAPSPSPSWYLDHLRAEVAATNDLLAGAELSAPVPACPDWTVGRLVDHVGAVFGWANAAVSSGEQPSGFPTRTDGDPTLTEWFAARAAAIVDTLAGLDPDASTWHHWPVEKVNRVWQRRMVHELAVHRWDLAGAVGAPATIDAELASDGIDEFLELFLPRKLGRDGVDLPTGSLHLHCTDVAGEWLLRLDGSDLDLVRAHQKGDAALRGPAETLLLWCWGRTATDDRALSPVGDESVLAEWRALMGT